MVLKKLGKLVNSLNVKTSFIMPKSEIHPKWYPDAKVICNGEVVMTTGSTKPGESSTSGPEQCSLAEA